MHLISKEVRLQSLQSLIQTRIGTEMEEEEKMIPEWASSTPCMMGIDQSGRSAVLGPLVYGGLCCPVSYENDLFGLGLADSKTLEQKERVEQFRKIISDEMLHWFAHITHPIDISSKMLQKNKISLDEISQESSMKLVQAAVDSHVKLTKVYVDTVGVAEHYAKKLTDKFPNIEFHVSKGADSEYPIVSGASIVAREIRDYALESWTFVETDKNLDKNYGTGQPAAKETQTWLKNHIHKVFMFPSIVRFSWKTLGNFYPEVVEVLWEDDKNGVSIKTGRKRRKRDIKQSTGKGRHSFFESRKLERVTLF